MKGGMIRAASDMAELQARLAARARKLAAARATMLAQQASPGKWRKASLLWPLFGQE